MLAPARTTAQDILYLQSLKALNACRSNDHDAARVRRFFSRRRPFRRSSPSRKGPSPPRNSGHATKRHGRTPLATELRKDVESKTFARLVRDRLNLLASEDEGTELSSLARQESQAFDQISTAKSQAIEGKLPSLYITLRQAYSDHGPSGLDSQIKYSLHGQLANARLTRANLEDQSKLADLRYPVEWYPGTRAIQRTIHLHVGPTNSGKTYQGLQRLEQAKTGIYAGPLRLLAHEVYTRLNAKGKTCHLITGDDKRIHEDDEEAMTSCTVEMVPTDRTVDVAVVDEIQMIGNEERGWAWSQALLGLKAKELHLCGEARTVPLIRELVAQMGDKLEIHHYERLSPLKAASRSLDGNLTRLRKGDCLVVFSRKEIHALKSEIERKTNKRVAIVYGSLPPETRARQARLFNDPSNDYDYLVASDAIGMGLNLDIKRIIFESTYKYNGQGFEEIPIAHLKQIAGRAGRYRIAPQSKGISEIDGAAGSSSPSATKLSASVAKGTVGLVTSLEQMDYARVRKAMQTEAEPIMSAGIFPPTKVLIRFAAYFPPGTPFSYIISRLHELSSLHPRYHLCKIDDQVKIADAIELVQDLTVADRIMFCASPAAIRLPSFNRIIVAFAECVANNTSGALLDIEDLNLEILDQKVTMEKEYLTELETLHKALILYIWLSYRFVGVFQSQDMAFYVKGMVEERIDKVLAQVSSTRKAKMKTLRQLAMLEELGTAFGDKKYNGSVGAVDDPGSFTQQPELTTEENEDEKVTADLEQTEPLLGQEESSSGRDDMGPLWRDLAVESPEGTQPYEGAARV